MRVVQKGLVRPAPPASECSGQGLIGFAACAGAAEESYTPPRKQPSASPASQDRMTHVRSALCAPGNCAPRNSCAALLAPWESPKRSPPPSDAAATALRCWRLRASSHPWNIVRQTLRACRCSVPWSNYKPAMYLPMPSLLRKNFTAPRCNHQAPQVILMVGRPNVATGERYAAQGRRGNYCALRDLASFDFRRMRRRALQLPPGPWPIRHWHNHQPRQSQLDAMHKSDVTPEEARKIDRSICNLSGATHPPDSVTRSGNSSAT